MGFDDTDDPDDIDDTYIATFIPPCLTLVQHLRVSVSVSVSVCE